MDKILPQICYHIDGELASRIDIHQQELERKSCFIVATNELDEEVLNNEQVIDLHKKGQQKVERGFRFRLALLLDGYFNSFPAFDY
jgi:hypothetical protein